MTVKPIPAALLGDSITLFVPESWGWTAQEISNVRVVRSSEVTDHAALNAMDVSELTVYYDCANSYPADVRFSAGMLLEHDGTRYELIRTEEFAAETLHHIRITARKI